MCQGRARRLPSPVRVFLLAALTLSSLGCPSQRSLAGLPYHLVYGYPLPDICLISVMSALLFVRIIVVLLGPGFAGWVSTPSGSRPLLGGLRTVTANGRAVEFSSTYRV